MAKGKKQKKNPEPENSSIKDSIPRESKPISLSKTWISWPVLAFSLVIILPIIVSAIFPALIESSTSSFKELEFYNQIVNPLELGSLGGIIIATNLVILGIAVMYYKKGMNLKKLFEFDISKKLSWAIVVAILAIYVAATVSELSTPETWGDFAPIEKRMKEGVRDDRWPIEDIIMGNPNFSASEPHVKFILLFFSYSILDNIKIIPFIASILLLLVTYVLTTKIANKRLAGILSLLLVLQSNIFLTYDTSATYSNFWIVFYLVSLWLILKKWQISHASFVLSLFSKALSAAFLPLTMFFIFRNTAAKKRLYLLASFGALIVLGLGLYGLISSETDEGKYIPENFWKGFAASAYQLRFDPIILAFLLPLTVALFMKSRRGFIQADSVSVLIAGVLIVPSLLSTFTAQTNEPYRLMPLVVFFAIGAGTLLAKIKKQDELLSR